MTDLAARLDALVEKESAENEQVRQFLLNNKGKLKELDVLGLKIQIPATIPRKLRHELAKIQKKGVVELEEAESDTYLLLSLLCQNKPYNNSTFWEALDEETGLAGPILAELLDMGYSEENKIKNFRGK